MIDLQAPSGLVPGSGNGLESGAPASTVLVLVEDQALRCATRLLLRMDGYQVLSAALLPEALEIAQEEHGIDILLVSDPSADGAMARQAVAAVREITGPVLKALVVTGHVPPALRSLQRQGLLQVVTTPIAADALLAQLQAFRRPPAEVRDPLGAPRTQG